MSRSAALLLLADSRFPTGAHAHSAGVEASHARGDIGSVADLQSFLEGRLLTTAPVDAAFAAAACTGASPDAVLDRELQARTPSPRLRDGQPHARPPAAAAGRAGVAQREVRRAAGPARRRADATDRPRCGRRCGAAHRPRRGAVLVAPPRRRGHHGSRPAAGSRPVPGARARRGARPTARRPRRRRGRHAANSAPCELPATTSLLADILAEHHATWEVRLFAS